MYSDRLTGPKWHFNGLSKATLLVVGVKISVYVNALLLWYRLNIGLSFATGMTFSL